MALKPSKKLAAKELQLMVRAEQAAKAMHVKCVVNGEVTTVYKDVRNCVCVTCGKVLPYKAAQQFGEENMQGGHFISSRRNSILLVEENVHPQCAGCNKYKGGAPKDYETYMRATWGQEVIDELRRRKNDSVTFTDEELIEFRTKFRERIKRAESIIRGDVMSMAEAIANAAEAKDNEEPKDTKDTKPTRAKRKKVKGELVLEGRDRQLTLAFDYEGAGIKESAATYLEEVATKTEVIYEAARIAAIKSELAIGKELIAARKKFRRGQDGEPTWASWVQTKFGMSTSTASRHMVVAKKLGNKDPEKLAGLPVIGMYRICREGVAGPLFKQALKEAETRYLSVRDIDKILGINQPEEETKTLPAPMQSEEEVATWVRKKVVASLLKKLNGLPVADTLPDILRKLADELSSKAAA